MPDLARRPAKPLIRRASPDTFSRKGRRKPGYLTSPSALSLHMAKPPPPKPTKTQRPPPGLPDRETLIKYLRTAGEQDKGDIARAFGLKGEGRRALRDMLRKLEDEGALGKRGRKGFAEAGALPPVGVADVVERDPDGELYVRLVKAGEDAPLARLAPARGEAVIGAPGMGDRVLVHFDRLETGEYEARLIKKLGQSAHRILGVIRKSNREVRVEPVDRKSKDSLVLSYADGEKLQGRRPGAGHRRKAQHQRYGPKHGKLVEIVGREDEPRAASLIAIHSHGIPTGFSEAAEKRRPRRKPPSRRRCRGARTCATCRSSPSTRRRPRPRRRGLRPCRSRGEERRRLDRLGGHRRCRRLRPAQYGPGYRRPRQVQQRLLPRPGRGDAAGGAEQRPVQSARGREPRDCMAVRMVFNKDGRKISHRFVRGLMRSHAKLSYEQAQIGHRRPARRQDRDHHRRHPAIRCGPPIALHAEGPARSAVLWASKATSAASA
jgi:ribonuclease R